KLCMSQQVDVHAAAWTHTPSSESFNPYQQINPDATTVNDESYTESMMGYCRSKLGSLCVLEDNGLRDVATTSNPLGGSYTSLFNKMASLGAPSTFQTATPEKLGS